MNTGVGGHQEVISNYSKELGSFRQRSRPISNGSYRRYAGPALPVLAGWLRPPCTTNPKNRRGARRFLRCGAVPLDCAEPPGSALVAATPRCGPGAPGGEGKAAIPLRKTVGAAGLEPATPCLEVVYATLSGQLRCVQSCYESTLQVPVLRAFGRPGVLSIQLSSSRRQTVPTEPP
jgi:hypothetical protein